MKRVSLKNKNSKQEYTGQAPSVFVGHYGYPNVNVGFLNLEKYTEEDEPLKWSAENKQIPEIIDLRTSLINSTFRTRITSFSDRLLKMGQEIAMSRAPVDVDIELLKKPNYKTTFQGVAQPHGPRIGLKKARLSGNVKIDRRVEKAVYDTDLKAGVAITNLFSKGVDEHKLSRLLSIGDFGVKNQRKMVPTRWSITAVDDTLGKQTIKDVKDLSEGDCRIYSGGYLGNQYVILLYDDLWSYELFEGYLPKLQKEGTVAWETDEEGYNGRKNYASQTAGGYYASRLAILESLKRERSQSSVIAFRFVTEEYTAPLGVWVVREAVRKAMSTTPTLFYDRNSMQTFAIEYCKRVFSFDITDTLLRSKTLTRFRTQQRLNRWL